MGLAAKAGGSETRALRQVFKPVIMQGQERIARIFALWHRGDDQARRQLGWNILERMDGAIDAAIKQGLFDLFGEKSLAAYLKQAAILNPVTGRGDLDQRRDLVGILGRAA